MKRVWSCMLALGIWLVGGWWVATQMLTLWSRIPESAMDRYAVDIAMPEIPTQLKKDELKALCTPEAEFPACLEATKVQLHQTDPATLQALQTSYANTVLRQHESASAILSLNPLDRALTDLRWYAHRNQNDALKQFKELGISITSESVDASPEANELLIRIQTDLTGRLAAHASRSGAALKRFSTPSLAEDEKWLAIRELGLLATGLRLERSFDSFPSQTRLSVDRQSLSSQLEWLRIGAEHGGEGAALRVLGKGLGAILVSGLLAIIVCVICGFGPVPVAIACVLLAISFLTLTDLALTGSVAFHNLPLRQFAVWELPLSHGWGVPLYLPLTGLAAGVAGVRVFQLPAMQLVWRPVDSLAMLSSGRNSAIGGLLLLVMTAGCVAFLGYSAVLSELVLLVAALALSAVIARQAAIASMSGYRLFKHGAYSLPILFVGVGAACAACLYRGDLGHLVVACVLAGAFLFLFGGMLWRALLLAALGGGLYLLFEYRAHGEAALISPLVEAIAEIKPHVAERLRAFHDAFAQGPSDLARVLWLQASAGYEGWGPGWVPWSGLPGNSAADGLPLQGPSDYASSLIVSIWGWRGGCILVIWAALFLYLFVRGMQIALRDQTSFRTRFIAAIGTTGCLAILVKGLLSIAGSVRLFPLTGVPIALLSYGPTAIWAALGYLLCVLTAHANTKKESSS